MNGHPGADRWDFLPSLSPLLGCERVALHINFLKFGGCLRAAIRGSLNTSFSSGFLKIIALRVSL